MESKNSLLEVLLIGNKLLKPCEKAKLNLIVSKVSQYENNLDINLDSTEEIEEFSREIEEVNKGIMKKFS